MKLRNDIKLRSDLKSFPLGFAVGATCLIIMSLVCSSISASPYIKQNSSEFNFGQIPFGSIVTHTFWIHSTENDTLVIDSVMPGCGCMTVPFIKDVIPPGDSAAYFISMNTESLRGAVVKRPAFKIKGDSVEHRFKLYADIIIENEKFFPIVFNPSGLDFSSYDDNIVLGPQEMQFSLTNLSDEEIELEVVDYPIDLIEINFPERLKGGETFKGSVKILKAFHKREFAVSVTLGMNQSEMYRLTIPLLRRISRYLWDQLNLPDSSRGR